MIELKLVNGNVVLNTENLLDQRQSKFETLFDGTLSSPIFITACGHIEESALNLLVKLKV